MEVGSSPFVGNRQLSRTPGERIQKLILVGW